MSRVASSVHRVLSERLMLSLSLLTLPGAVLQLLEHPSTQDALVLYLVDWAVIAAFILEYSSKLDLAPSRTRYVKDYWNLLNLLIIALAFSGILVSSPLFFSAPLLRIFRATKVLTESGRTSHEVGAGVTKAHGTRTYAVANGFIS